MVSEPILLAKLLLIQTLALAGGAALVLIRARRVRPGWLTLTAFLLGSAVISSVYGTVSDDIRLSLAFALAAGAGAAAAAIDARHQLLPDTGAGLIALCGLVSALVRGEVLAALIAGVLSAAILIAAGWLTRRPGRIKPLGEGDVLLAGSCGLWLLPHEVPYALLVAVALTVGTGLASGAWRPGGCGRVAFGPGIAAGYGASVSYFAALGAGS